MWMAGIYHRLVDVAAVIAVAAFSSLPTHAADIRVPADFPTIQQAIDAAAAGDTVLVSNGVWSGEGNRDLDLRGKVITVAAAGGIADCILNSGGSEAEPHRAFDLSRNEGRSAVIRGFTIRGGHVAGDFDEDDGGGIRLRGSSPSILDCIFFENSSGGAGGGIACLQGSNALIQGCTFNENDAFDGGGAVGCDASSPVIRDNLMIWNGAYRYGGAVMCYQGSSPQIIGNEIVESTAEFGGGISCHQYSSPLIEDNVISGNSAAFSGGGMLCAAHSSPHIRNNLIKGNASNLGGGMYISYRTSPVVENCTFVNNVATVGGGISGSECWITLTGCILWGNQADQGEAINLRSRPEPSWAHILWTDIQGGDNAVVVDDGVFVTWGPGVISADPLFVRGPDGPFYLSQIAAGQDVDSPCLDAGDPSTPPPAGSTRTDHWPDRGVTDLGFHREPNWAPVCDIDRSGRVDGGDLSIFALAWGAAEGGDRYDPRADFDCSGTVDGEDLAILASAFGYTMWN